MVRNEDKEAGEEKINWNYFPITLSFRWQVKVFTIIIPFSSKFK